LTSGTRPDRFLVGLAFLSLLSDAADQEPLLCLIDDAQWLDQSSAQVLAFVARRLKAESIALAFAEREPGELDSLAGLPELRLEGLSDVHARELLGSVVSGPLDERVAERIVAETHGNPLALRELPYGSSPAELAGGFTVTAALPLPGLIEESFRERVERLPAESQRLLLLAAAEPIGDPALLWRAAERLELGPDAAAPAEAADLLTLGARVTFRHPLLRSAIYRAASPEERRSAHQVLAAATDPKIDPDRRAWHRAQATVAPDEDVAAELERSADRARSRGGLAAAAAFLERSAALTPDPAHRAGRELTAAQAKHEADAPTAALKLLTAAEDGPLDELQRARIERLRAQLAFGLRRGSDAPPLLLAAAKRLGPLNAELARETYLEALAAAIFAGRLGSAPGVVEVADAARAAPQAPRPARAIDLLLDGLTSRFTDGYAAGVPQLRQALEAVSRDEGHTDDDTRWLWLACRIAPDLWEDEAWHELATRELQLARDSGALNVLPLAPTYRAGVHVHAGEFAAAEALSEEADAITEATGNAPLGYTSLVLAACRGQRGQPRPAQEARGSAAGTRSPLGNAPHPTANVREPVEQVLAHGRRRHEHGRRDRGRGCGHTPQPIARTPSKIHSDARQRIRCPLLGEPYRQGAAGRFTKLAKGFTAAGAALVAVEGDGGRARRWGADCFLPGRCSNAWLSTEPPLSRPPTRSRPLCHNASARPAAAAK
jgi:hypothetical protein